MGYKMKLVRSFSSVEPQKFRVGVLAACFLVTLTYFSMTKPFALPLPTMNSRLSLDKAAAPPENITMTAKMGALENSTLESKLRCNFSDPRSGLCEKHDVDVLGTNSTTRLEGKQLETNGTKEELNDDLHYDQYSSSKGQDAYNTQQLESEDIVKEKSPLQDDPGSPQHQMDGELKIWKNFSASPAVNSTTIVGTHDLSKKLGEDGRSVAVNPVEKLTCDFSDRRTSVCEMEGDVRIIGKSSSVIFVTSSQMGNSATNESWQISPYARKADRAAMGNVREVAVKSLGSIGEAPQCTLNHSVPAIIFSVTGYTGNYFHDFTDVIVPIFLTSQQFDGQVQFLVTNFRSWWINKYLPIFKRLSRYEIIDFDNDERVHCFPHAIVGLKAHKDLTIEPSRPPIGHSMVEFTKFMRRTYSLERDVPLRLGRIPSRKPRLLLIARARTRRFTNLDMIVRMAEKLGFEVVVAEQGGGEVARFAQLVNSCDVMMGVHGAGLTNLVFLPTNAILIQIVPWGKLEWIAATYFREPAKDMKLRYLEYSISEDESTLIDQYPRDHPVFKDPTSIHKLGWNGMMEIYLVKQNVKLNVKRFRRVLAKALKLLHQKG